MSYLYVSVFLKNRVENSKHCKNSRAQRDPIKHSCTKISVKPATLRQTSPWLMPGGPPPPCLIRWPEASGQHCDIEVNVSQGSLHGRCSWLGSILWKARWDQSPKCSQVVQLKTDQTIHSKEHSQPLLGVRHLSMIAFSYSPIALSWISKLYKGFQQHWFYCVMLKLGACQMIKKILQSSNRNSSSSSSRLVFLKPLGTWLGSDLVIY